MRYQKEIKEKYNVDVFVAGGGAAGIAAAIAAARQGKSVLLVESTGCLGGVGTSGLVPCFAPFGDGVNILARGIGLEIRKAVSKAFPLNTEWTPINSEELKRAYDKIVQDEGIKLSLFTTVCDVISNNGHIDGVILNAKSGLFCAKAKVYIDCTGDGDLCAMAGADFEIGDENGNVMPPTLCSIWANLDLKKIRDGVDHKTYLEDAFKDGVFTYEDRLVSGFFMFDESGVGGANLGHIFNSNPIDEISLTEGMIWGRKSMLEFEKYYKKYLNGYENMTLCATGSILGVRESRRIICDYTLNIDDFKNRAVFEDEIGRYCYPIDMHVMNTKKEEHERFLREFENELRYNVGESYGIPYRSLIPKKLTNVLVAGRCIGTDRKMQASIRVMPCCFITGQAAGVAAALAVEDENVRNVDFGEIGKRLIDFGAYLPNF